MSYETYRAIFTRINRRLGTNWSPHDLRHTACVRMLDAGMALYQVQEIMGHRHLSATQKYLRPRLDELIEAHREAQARPRPQPSGPGPTPSRISTTCSARDDDERRWGRGAA